MQVKKIIFRNYIFASKSEIFFNVQLRACIYTKKQKWIIVRVSLDKTEKITSRLKPKSKQKLESRN